MNAKCQNHETALMSASDKGHLDVVSMLIEKGADINAKSIDGDTALAKAANKRNCQFFKYNFAGLSYDVSKLDINYKKIIETLLDAGADVNGLDKNNRCLEEIIEKRNNIKMTHLVIKKGLTRENNVPLMQYAHRETICRIVSFY